MPIKRSFFVMLLSVVCTLNLSIAQNDSGSVASKILALEREWNTAYKRSDISAMDRLLADDFIITVEDGTTFSKPGYIAHNGNSTVHVEVSDMSDLKIRTHDDAAVVTGMYHEKGTDKGKPYDYEDRFTDVWVKINGRWQVLASHYSFRTNQ